MRPLQIQLLLLPLVPLALIACQASSSPKEKDIQHLVRHHRWREALDAAARQAEARPDDPEARLVHQQVSVAVLLERGRRLTFDDQDDEALAVFEKARQIDPDNEHVRIWIEKTREKLGRRWYERGSIAHANDNLEAARAGYETALEFTPGHELARQGLATCILQINYRYDLSDEYYNDGVKAISDWKYIVAHSRFDYSRKYRPDDEKRKQRLREAAQQLARERVMVAKSLEEREFFGAAHGDYRVAALMDETNEEARAGAERTKIEAEAAKYLRQGDMFVLRREFENAEEAYRQGKEVTLSRQDVFDGAIASIDDARVAEAYELALVMEHDFRYEDALVIYDEILAQREFYEDVLARRSTLQDYVDDAAELYAQAQDASSPQERADLLRQIEIFWPEYLDIQSQLELLRETTVTEEPETTTDDGEAPVIEESAAGDGK